MKCEAGSWSVKQVDGADVEVATTGWLLETAWKVGGWREDTAEIFEKNFFEVRTVQHSTVRTSIIVLSSYIKGFACFAVSAT